METSFKLFVSLGLLGITLLLVGCVQQEPPKQAGIFFEDAMVARVIDGDTIELANGQRVRYLAIDAPESVHPEKPVQCYGSEAAERNKELVEGKSVQLLRDGEDTDPYGRLLRYVFVDGTLVNAQLVWEGFAVARSFGLEPSLYQVIVQLERSAREDGRGLWGSCPVTQ